MHLSLLPLIYLLFLFLSVLPSDTMKIKQNEPKEAPLLTYHVKDENGHYHCPSFVQFSCRDLLGMQMKEYLGQGRIKIAFEGIINNQILVVRSASTPRCK